MAGGTLPGSTISTRFWRPPLVAWRCCWVLPGRWAQRAALRDRVALLAPDHSSLELLRCPPIPRPDPVVRSQFRESPESAHLARSGWYWRMSFAEPTTAVRRRRQPFGSGCFSDWALPPPAALAAGECEPVRMFDTAEAALAFLAAMAAVSNGSRLRPLVAAYSAV